MARPRKAAADKRENRLYPRLTTEELVWVEDKAKALGISASDFMRRRTFGYRLPDPSYEAKARASLALAFNRLGNNMNQIAHRLHSGGEPSGVEAELLDLIEQVRAALESLYRGPGSDQGRPQL